MNRLIATLMTLFVLLAGTVFIASPASATHPVVSGTVVCNPDTGLFDITWTVGGDQNYPEATATVVTQNVVTTPTFVGQSVQDTESVSATQSVPTAGHYFLAIQVQFDTHPAGQLTDARGDVTAIGECDDPVVEPPKPDPTREVVKASSYECGDRFKTVTTTVTTTDWVLVDNVWVKAEPVVTKTTKRVAVPVEPCDKPVVKCSKTHAPFCKVPPLPDKPQRTVTVVDTPPAVAVPTAVDAGLAAVDAPTEPTSNRNLGWAGIILGTLGILLGLVALGRINK